MKKSNASINHCACILLGSLLLACTEEVIEPDPKVQPDPGLLTAYEIKADKGFQVTDTLTGALFAFPDGGSGALTVQLDTSVIAGDSIIKAFTLEYTGTGAITARVKKFVNGYSGLMRYYEPVSVISEGDTSFLNWYTVPIDKDSGGYISCSVELSDIALLKSAKARGKSGKFLSFSHAEESQATKTRDFFQAAVTRTIDSMLVRMTPSLKTTADTRIKGDYTYTVSVYNWFKSLYSPQYRDWWRDIMLLSDNDVTNAAHETGHYLHHALVGTEKFKVFAANGVKDHWIGMTKSRDNLIEEYAYWVEFLMTDFIKRTLNPENGELISGGWADNNIDLKRDPGKVDFPSLEGFAVGMFASVLRTKTTITPFSLGRKDVPVITSIKPSDIFTWESQGCNSVDALRDSIEKKLTTAEKALLPVVLQPLGWTYPTSGVVASQDKKGVADCKVYNVISDGGTEYIADSSEETSSGGTFHIRYSFPGSSKFKVKYNRVNGIYQDSMLYEKTIDWKSATTTMIQLDTLSITVAPPKGRVRNIIMSIPGSEPLYGLDIAAGLMDDIALTTDQITLYLRPRFTPSSGAEVSTDIDVDYSISVDAVVVKTGAITLSPSSTKKYAEGSKDVSIGTLTKGSHTIRLTLDPDMKITDQTLANFDQYRVINHPISVADSYL
jgi:hypothetical protein